MNDLIEKIGPFLGVAAFVGLAVLAFLIFQQAREVRRLREWAGRAPERADEAAEASLAAAEARGEPVEDEAQLALRGRFGALVARLGGRLAPLRGGLAAGYGWLDRRMPVEPRYLLVVLAAVIVAAGVLTGGFGLIGGDGDDQRQGRGERGQRPEKVEVTVLNATQQESEVTGEEIAGVQGLANQVAQQVVKPAGYAIGAKADAPSGLEETVIMFESSEGADAAENGREAEKLAGAVTEQLGETEVTPMVQEVRDLAQGAPLALVVGADDAEL